jgi:RNA polymerase sigma-70 factor, ECF subfamily
MNREKLFREAIAENKQRIFRICSYYFSDPDDRNDAYQDSLVRIWDKISSFKGKSRISTWIYRVVVNTCLIFLRKDKKRREIFCQANPPESMMNFDPEVSGDPQQPGEKIRFFRDFMDRISVSDRTLVSLYLEELSSREMAEITGLSETNVRVKLYRIKEQIKKEWEEKNHGIG